MIFIFWDKFIFGISYSLLFLILFPSLLSPIFTEFFPLSSLFTTVKQTLSSSLKLCLCLSHLSNGISQCWELRKWNRKHCIRKSNSSLSSRGGLMHENLSILMFIPLHIILMSLQLPLHYLLLVKSISNLQVLCLLPVKLRHAGRAVNADWYFKCQGAHWLLRGGWAVQFGSKNNY